MLGLTFLLRVVYFLLYSILYSRYLLQSDLMLHYCMQPRMDQYFHQMERSLREEDVF